MKKQLLIMSMLAGAVTASAAVGDKYQLVTSIEEVSSGEFLIIGAKSTGETYALGTTQNKNNRAAVEVSVIGDIATETEETAVVKINQEGNSTWSLYVANGDTMGYLYAAGGSSNNYLRTQDTVSVFTITYDAGSTTPLIEDSNVSRGKLKFNPSSAIFSCYASGQNEVSLYKKVEESGKEQAGLSFAEPSLSVYFGDTTEGLLLNNPNNLTVSYSSSNTEVATVDATTGAITLVGPGETVITATSEETDAIAAGKASYTLTVIASAANLADFEKLGLTSSSLEILMNCDLGVVYQNGNYTYVVDAEGNAGLVYGKGQPTFEAGNTMGKGWIGKISVYNGLTEIVPVDAASLTVSDEEWNGSLDALEITAADIENNINRKVYVKNVEFTEATPSSKASFTGEDADGNTVTFYNTFSMGDQEPGIYNIIGFAAVNIYKEETTYQIYPISYEEVVALPEVAAMLNGDELQNGLDFHMQGAEKAEITFSVSEGASVVYSFVPANEESEKIENATLEGNTLTLTEAGELTFKAVKGELESEPVTVTISGFAAEINTDVEVTDAEGKVIEDNTTISSEDAYTLTLTYAETAELYYNFTAAPGSEVEGEVARKMISIDGVEYTKADANPFTFNVEKSGTLKYFAIDNEVYGEVKTINFDIATGVASIEAENGEARYYDLNGREVKGNLERGVYVRVLNGEASKMIVK